jgi:hypothetical protein
MTMLSAPRSVGTPPTEAASRQPSAVVSNSAFARRAATSRAQKTQAVVDGDGYPAQVLPTDLHGCTVADLRMVVRVELAQHLSWRQPEPGQ